MRIRNHLNVKFVNICSCAKKCNMNRHIKMVHEEKKPFKCELCDKSFFQKVDRKKHVESIHEGKKPFKCELCDKSFSQKGSRKIHVESVHEGKKPFQCEICDIFFLFEAKTEETC